MQKIQQLMSEANLDIKDLKEATTSKRGKKSEPKKVSAQWATIAHF